MKRLSKGFAVVFALLAGLAASTFGYASWNVNSRHFDVPDPDIHADSSPAALARGEQIFGLMCGDCHGDRTTGRASGRFEDDVPAFLGTFNSANLTRDPVHGIANVPDGTIARTLRTGIRRDGTANAILMPKFGAMGDADIAAILGYMRSASPVFDATATTPPRSKPSRFPGYFISTFVLPPEPENATRKIGVPVKKASEEYGRYMANDVYQCWFCHTEGFSPKKLDAPGVYSGGFEFVDGAGKQIFSTNITPSGVGIGNWTYAQFATAMRDGVRPDGYLVRSPMGKIRVDDVEMEAMFAYLQSVPKSEKANKTGTSVPIKAPPPDTKPAELFVALGCPTCHAKGAPYHAKIKECVGKPVDVVAAWIRNPEKTKPATQMPTFESLLTVEQATGLAAWVQAGPALEN